MPQQVQAIVSIAKDEPVQRRTVLVPDGVAFRNVGAFVVSRIDSGSSHSASGMWPASYPDRRKSSTRTSASLEWAATQAVSTSCSGCA